MDLYRYFDAIQQAEFIYSCVQLAIAQTIPEDIDYLEKYDRFKYYLDNYFEIPDKEVALLVRFLAQGKGQLSVRAIINEFKAFTDTEVLEVEEKYREIFQ